MNDLVKLNDMLSGFIQISRINPSTGLSEVVVNKPNTILYQGADVTAWCIGGRRNSAISHMYLAYADTIPANTINKSNTTFQVDSTSGYLRIPLTTSPSYQPSDSNYENNIATFTITLTSANEFRVGSSPALTSASKFYQVALVASTNPAGSISNTIGDKVFSRAAFSSIIYDPTYNWSVYWGIRVTS